MEFSNCTVEIILDVNSRTLVTNAATLSLAATGPIRNDDNRMELADGPSAEVTLSPAANGEKLVIPLTYMSPVLRPQLGTYLFRGGPIRDPSAPVHGSCQSPPPLYLVTLPAIDAYVTFDVPPEPPQPSAEDPQPSAEPPQPSAEDPPPRSLFGGLLAPFHSIFPGRDKLIRLEAEIMNIFKKAEVESRRVLVLEATLCSQTVFQRAPDALSMRVGNVDLLKDDCPVRIAEAEAAAAASAKESLAGAKSIKGAMSAAGNVAPSANASNSAATKIERGGIVAAEKLGAGSKWLGGKAKDLSEAQKARADKSGSVGTKEITEEERARIAKKEENAANFHKGVRKVSGGLSNAFHKTGAAFAKTYHKARTAEVVTNRFPVKEKEPAAEDDQKAAAAGVGSALIKAGGTIFSGAGQAGRDLTRDVRDAHTGYIEHTQGEEAAELKRRQWQVAGRVGLGTFGAVSLAFTSIISVGIGVTMGALGHDPNAATILGGMPWFSGWLSPTPELMEQWESKWATVNTYSLVIWNRPKLSVVFPEVLSPKEKEKQAEKEKKEKEDKKDKKEKDSKKAKGEDEKLPKPIDYIPYENIHAVSVAEVRTHPHAIRIDTYSSTFYFSVHETPDLASDEERVKSRDLFIRLIRALCSLVAADPLTTPPAKEKKEGQAEGDETVGQAASSEGQKAAESKVSPPRPLPPASQAPAAAPLPPASQAAAPLPPASQAAAPLPPASQAAAPLPPASQAAAPLPPASQAAAPLPPASQAAAPLPPASQAAAPLPPASQAAAPLPPASTAGSQKPAPKLFSGHSAPRFAPMSAPGSAPGSA